MSSVTLSDGRQLDADDAGQNVAVLDSTYATSSDLAVGDTINVGGADLEIVGIVTSSSSDADTAANVYIPLDVAQTLAGTGDVISTVYVQASSADDISSVQSAIEEALPDATVSSQSDLASTVSGSLSSASSLISSLGTWLSVILLAVAVLLAVLFTISGVSRRTREFGTLKAIGWSNGRVVRQVAGESLVQGLIGGVIGVAVGLIGVLVINLVHPTISSDSGDAAASGADIGCRTGHRRARARGVICILDRVVVLGRRADGCCTRAVHPGCSRRRLAVYSPVHAGDRRADEEHAHQCATGEHRGLGPATVAGTDAAEDQTVQSDDPDEDHLEHLADCLHDCSSIRATRRTAGMRVCCRRVAEMAMPMKDFSVEHPVDRGRVEEHKELMLAEVRAYRLREQREETSPPQAQLAERIGVGQRQVSTIKRGDLDRARIGTIRSYLEAVGGGPRDGRPARPGGAMTEVCEPR